MSTRRNPTQKPVTPSDSMVIIRGDRNAKKPSAKELRDMKVREKMRRRDTV